MVAVLTSAFLLATVSSLSWTLIPVDGFPYYCMFCDCKNTTNGGMSTNCSMKGFTNPPRVINYRSTELNFRRNNFKVIRYQYFAGLVNLKRLDLSQNLISSIEKGAFRDLENLEYLFLNGQRHTSMALFVLHRVFGPGVFYGLKNVRVLHIQDNVDGRDVIYSKVPSESLKDLANLNILRIDGLPGVSFNESFNALQNFKILEMSGNFGTCEIGHLDNTSFVGLKFLKQLKMVNCRIRTIGTDTFKWLVNLEYLDISWNTNLGFVEFERAAEDIGSLTQLQYLNITAIHDSNRACSQLLGSTMYHLRDTNIIEIQMNNNGIEFVEYNVLSSLPSSLKRIYLRNNKLIFGGIFMELAIFKNRNLTIFDAADQLLVMRSDRAFTSSFDNAFTGGLYDKNKHANFNRRRRNEFTRLELTTLICSGSSSDIRIIDFMHTDNNITYMDLSGNFLPKIHAKAFSGLYSLAYLNLSNNYIESVHQTAFDGLWNLEILDLGNNLLGMSVRVDSDGMLSQSLSNLKELHLARNRIYRIDKNFFAYIYDIEYIDLSYNYLESVDFSLIELSKLKKLDLSNNVLQTLPGSLRLHINQLAKKHLITVNMNRNTLVCNCANIPFLEWLFQTTALLSIDKDQNYCSLNTGGVLALNGTLPDEIEQMKTDCISYLEIIVGSSTSLGFLVAILICLAVYYNRWRLRYMYYMAKVKLQHEGGKHGRDENAYEFHAFLSYGDGDRIFAIEDMRLNLENVSGKSLNIRDRDFELGEAIAVNISRAIRTSKRTFLLVSRYFLKSKWCNFEMNMAIMEEINQKRKAVVIIFLETIPPNSLPIELLGLLRKCPNMDLPKEPELMEVFWHKCIQYIDEI